MANTSSSNGYAVSSKASSRVNLTPDSNSTGPQPTGGGASQMLDARRRHNAITRRTYAREAGLLKEDGPGEGTGDGFDYTVDDVKAVASAMFDQYKAGRITRGQIEADQRADSDRLTGWKVAPPAPGTSGAEKLERLTYRIAVRSIALKAINKFELPYLVGSTARMGRSVDTRNPDQPWRPGAEAR